MSLIVPATSLGKIQLVQDMSKFQWAGVPFEKRYEHVMLPPDLMALLKQIRQIDQFLDLKIYRPNGLWHLVRYPNGFDKGFVRVWELDDRPDLGLRKEPGSWMIDALKAADTLGHAANRAEEVDEHNRKIEESNQRSVNHAAEETAKDLRKPLQHLYDFGDNGSYKGAY